MVKIQECAKFSNGRATIAGRIGEGSCRFSGPGGRGSILASVPFHAMVEVERREGSELMSGPDLIMVVGGKRAELHYGRGSQACPTSRGSTQLSVPKQKTVAGIKRAGKCCGRSREAGQVREGSSMNSGPKQLMVGIAECATNTYGRSQEADRVRGGSTAGSGPNVWTTETSKRTMAIPPQGQNGRVGRVLTRVEISERAEGPDGRSV